MDTQRDLKIAERAGLNVKVASIDYEKGEITATLEGKIWNPSENPAQLQMIEDWVIEQGYSINMDRQGQYTLFEIGKWKEHPIRHTIISSATNKLKSEAFLQAVEQLIDNLNKQS